MSDYGTRILDLTLVVNEILKHQPEVEKIYLFGSRAYETGSYGSDIDLLLDTNGRQNPILFIELRKFEPYIDLFQIKGNIAESAGNLSQIRSPEIKTKEELIEKIEAIEIWNNNKGWVNDKFKLQRVIRGRAPDISICQSLGIDDPSRPIFDFLIITTVQEEFDAVFDTLNQIAEEVPCTCKTVHGFYISTTFGNRTIALSKSHRMGTVAAALNTQKCILEVSPRLVILVGITAGIQGEVNLGDLVIPDRIVEYEMTRVGVDGERNQGLIRETHGEARQKISMWGDRDVWLNSIKRDVLDSISIDFFSDGPDIKICTGAMASGNKVVTDPRFIQKIQTLFGRKIISLEMEAIGVAEACDTNSVRIPFIVIKSVSDFADSTKNDDWHSFCSQISAKFTTTLIEEGII